MLGVPVTVKPAASRGTMNSEMPASSSMAPLVRAEMTKKLAASPCATTDLAPVSVQPSPARAALVATRAIS